MCACVLEQRSISELKRNCDIVFLIVLVKLVLVHIMSGKALHPEGLGDSTVPAYIQTKMRDNNQELMWCKVTF